MNIKTGTNYIYKNRNSQLSFGYDKQANEELSQHAPKTTVEKEIVTLQKMCNGLEDKIMENERTSSIAKEDVNALICMKVALAGITMFSAKETDFVKKEYDHYREEHEKSSNNSNPIKWRKILMESLQEMIDVKEVLNTAQNQTNVPNTNTNGEIEQYCPPPYILEKGEIDIFV